MLCQIELDAIDVTLGKNKNFFKENNVQLDNISLCQHASYNK